jgi:hypothetical protein
MLHLSPSAFWGRGSTRRGRGCFGESAEKRETSSLLPASRQRKGKRPHYFPLLREYPKVEGCLGESDVGKGKCPCFLKRSSVVYRTSEQYMGCNAWNHPSNCKCGWGGEWHGNHVSEKVNYNSWPPAKKIAPRADYRSLTIPNAQCPVCGSDVFFYQNETGSRVFFDELGPPWRKHPCTDNRIWRYSLNVRIRHTRSASPKSRTGWIENKWIPFLVIDVDHRKIHLKNIRDDTEMVIELDRVPRVNALQFAYCVVQKGTKGTKVLRVSMLDTDSLQEQEFQGTRLKNTIDIPTGFLWHCERERQICMRIDADREIAALRARS